MTKQKASWEDHVVGFSREPVAALVAMANPKNYRRHPVEQRKIFSGVAGSVGIVAPVLVNDRTKHMLDGHMRVSEAQIAGMEKFPVIHVDIPEDDELVVLATFDPVSAMAFEDAAMKAELLKTLHSDNPDIQEYLDRELERQMAEAMSGDDLSALGEKYGQHDPTAFWPVIRIRVPTDVRVRFMAYFKGIVADDDVARVVILLDRLKAPMIDPDDYPGEIDDE